MYIYTRIVLMIHTYKSRTYFRNRTQVLQHVLLNSYRPETLFKCETTGTLFRAYYIADNISLSNL